jgi:hypothetical protein
MLPAVLMHHQNTLELTRSALVVIDMQEAFRKMQMSGAIPCSVELVLFELMRDAKHEQFRAIQGLIK